MAVHEAVIDHPPRGDAYQTTVYAIDAETMTVGWRDTDVGGIIYKVYHVAAQGPSGRMSWEVGNTPTSSNASWPWTT